MEVTMPTSLLISFATFFTTLGGTWFVTQRRLREVERKVENQDHKHEQIIDRITGLEKEFHEFKLEIKTDMTKMQGSITNINDKLDLLIQGKIATPALKKPAGKSKKA